MKISNVYSMFAFSGLIASQIAWSVEPVKLKNQFNIDEVSWVKEVGDSSVYGKAFLKLKDKSIKNCASFNIELLPVSDYSNERIFKTYGNNDHGQVLLEDNPPKFTPDAKEYHELLLKSSCNEKGEFLFDKVPSGEYYVMAFIIWDVNENGKKSKSGGAVMKRIKVESSSENRVEL